MCGLVISPTPARAALKALAHRGIRSNYVEYDRGWIGHARLPIVGVDEMYDQPIEPFGSHWKIAFVGELLDFREHQPGMVCDADLVAKTWLNHGAAGFSRFDGFWSIAALDDRTGDIHLLVDYLAQKPLYYRNDLRMAASEPLAISFGLEPDEVYLSSVVKWGYCPETWRTPYSGMFKTEPGEHVVMRGDGSLDHEVTDPLHIVPLTPPEIKRELELAVRRRVQSSDVPVAALVSGGLDSAIVYTLAKRYGEVLPYHVENGERREAEKVMGDSTSYGTFLGKPVVSFEEALGIMQEPIDLGSLVPQVSLSRLVRERVCLTGDGADEFWGGYGRAQRYDSQGSDVFHELVGWHLPRLDRVMMRQRIEVRSPFLARRVCEAALATPWILRQDKKILREMFRDDLPPGVADVPKRALRVVEVERDREGHSRKLVELFRRKAWPTNT